MNKKHKLKISFIDFWREISSDEIERYLSYFRKEYDIELVKNNPDLVIYSCFGEEHFNYRNEKKLFICGENIVPDFNMCDYAISTVKMQYANKNLWIPESFFSSKHLLKNERKITKELAERKFCSFIYSQDTVGKGARLRREFCSMLMQQYKNVDCPGKILHNFDSDKLSLRGDVESWHKSKLLFLNDYKFNIAFENSSAPGYITEKLVDCYMANTVPIYWGSEGDVYPYPKESMICANDYPDLETLCNRIREVDENDEAYLNILRANPFYQENRGKLPNFEEEICSFIRNIVENDSYVVKSESTLTDSHRCYKYICERRRLYEKIATKLKRWLNKLLVKIQERI